MLLVQVSGDMRLTIHLNEIFVWVSYVPQRVYHITFYHILSLFSNVISGSAEALTPKLAHWKSEWNLQTQSVVPLAYFQTLIVSMNLAAKEFRNLVNALVYDQDVGVNDIFITA